MQGHAPVIFLAFFVLDHHDWIMGIAADRNVFGHW